MEPGTTCWAVDCACAMPPSSSSAAMSRTRGLNICIAHPRRQRAGTDQAGRAHVVGREPARLCLAGGIGRSGLFRRQHHASTGVLCHVAERGAPSASARRFCVPQLRVPAAAPATRARAPGRGRAPARRGVRMPARQAVAAAQAGLARGPRNSRRSSVASAARSWPVPPLRLAGHRQPECRRDHR